jgi:phenylalanyl-tRNA synthetase beta chain
MKISLNWLREHLDWSGKSVEDLEQLLTFAGVEIEGVIAQGVQSNRVVVAQVMQAEQHPNADRLKVTQVDAGEGELRQIVCGAQNYRVGDKVPCALPGAILPNGFTIGETTMRGVLSRGMLCAASEIGWTDRESGLMILDADAPVGMPIQELLGADVLLEVEVTPNRPDLLSHRGLARELSALLQQELKPRAGVALATRVDEEGLFI